MITYACCSVQPCTRTLDVQMTSLRLMFMYVSQFTSTPLYVSPFFSSTNWVGKHRRRGALALAPTLNPQASPLAEPLQLAGGSMGAVGKRGKNCSDILGDYMRWGFVLVVHSPALTIIA